MNYVDVFLMVLNSLLGGVGVYLKIWKHKQDLEHGEQEKSANQGMRFFLMQKHIQQVSLSELMTSWCHILPPPSTNLVRQEQWEGCERRRGRM